MNEEELLAFVEHLMLIDLTWYVVLYAFLFSLFRSAWDRLFDHFFPYKDV